MKPFFDISKSNGFTVWESGCWNEDKHFGYGILVAGPDGSPLQVIYDRDPTRNLKHALFYATAGILIAGCYSKRKGNKRSFDLEVIQIVGLNTAIVQGHPVPRYTDKKLFLSRKLVDIDTPIQELIAEAPDLPSIPNLKELLELAVVKSLTPSSQQRIFYGVPRERQTDE